jgi:hypothetical protein
MAELLPIMWDNGKKKKQPAAIPAEPAEFYRWSISNAVSYRESKSIT